MADSDPLLLDISLVIRNLCTSAWGDNPNALVALFYKSDTEATPVIVDVTEVVSDDPNPSFQKRILLPVTKVIADGLFSFVVYDYPNPSVPHLLDTSDILCSVPNIPVSRVVDNHLVVAPLTFPLSAPQERYSQADVDRNSTELIVSASIASLDHYVMTITSSRTLPAPTVLCSSTEKDVSAAVATFHTDRLTTERVLLALDSTVSMSLACADDEYCLPSVASLLSSPLILSLADVPLKLILTRAPAVSVTPDDGKTCADGVTMPTLARVRAARALRRQWFGPASATIVQARAPEADDAFSMALQNLRVALLAGSAAVIARAATRADTQLRAARQGGADESTLGQAEQLLDKARVQLQLASACEQRVASALASMDVRALRAAVRWSATRGLGHLGAAQHATRLLSRGLRSVGGEKPTTAARVGWGILACGYAGALSLAAQVTAPSSPLFAQPILCAIAAPTAALCTLPAAPVLRVAYPTATVPAVSVLSGALTLFLVALPLLALAGVVTSLVLALRPRQPSSGTTRFVATLNMLAAALLPFLAVYVAAAAGLPAAWSLFAHVDAPLCLNLAAAAALWLSMYPPRSLAEHARCWHQQGLDLLAAVVCAVTSAWLWHDRAALLPCACAAMGVAMRLVCDGMAGAVGGKMWLLLGILAAAAHVGWYDLPL